MELADKILGVLQETADAIKRNMSEENVNASGRTSASVQVRQRGNSFQLVAGGRDTAPWETVELGSHPTGDYFQLRPRIVQWTRDKGINVQSESHRWAIATVISKNIIAHGTRRYRQNINIYSRECDEASSKLSKMINKESETILKQVVKNTNTK